jgi:tetratricopeptide (TPR) repeat protein
MSFDKIKAMRSAERFIAQGNIRSAISEFKQVVANDPKDFGTMNMLGDLCVKTSDHREAIRCYTAVAEHYGKQGFAQKAIAVYNKIARLQPDDLRPRLWIDGALAYRGINEQVTSEMTTLAPFGAGNPRPVFRASRVEVIDGPRRIKDRHLKMAFKQDGRIMRGVAWRAIERETFVTEHRSAIDLAFSLDQDTWNGERYLQLSVADFKEPDS